MIFFVESEVHGFSKIKGKPKIIENVSLIILTPEKKCRAAS
jgi:hypothetical protein